MGACGEFVIVYDVSDNQERSRVSKILEGFGFRVQESVFECILTVTARERLRHYLSELDLQTGFVKFYRISGNAEKIIVGQAPASPIKEGCVFVV